MEWNMSVVDALVCKTVTTMEWNMSVVDALVCYCLR